MTVSRMVAGSHARHLSSSLSFLTNSDPDVNLVSIEGFLVPTHSMLLSLHSPYLRPLLISSSTSLAISIPLPAHPLAALLGLLATGNSKHEQPFDPIQVKIFNSNLF